MYVILNAPYMYFWHACVRWGGGGTRPNFVCCTVPGYPGGLLAVLVGVPFIYVFILFLCFFCFFLFFFRFKRILLLGYYIKFV